MLCISRKYLEVKKQVYTWKEAESGRDKERPGVVAEGGLVEWYVLLSPHMLTFIIITWALVFSDLLGWGWPHRTIMLLSTHMLTLLYYLSVGFLVIYLVRVTPYMPTRNISHKLRVSISGDLPGDLVTCWPTWWRECWCRWRWWRAWLLRPRQPPPMTLFVLCSSDI